MMKAKAGVAEIRTYVRGLLKSKLCKFFATPIKVKGRTPRAMALTFTTRVGAFVGKNILHLVYNHPTNKNSVNLADFYSPTGPGTRGFINTSPMGHEFFQAIVQHEPHEELHKYTNTDFCHDMYNTILQKVRRKAMEIIKKWPDLDQLGSARDDIKKLAQSPVSFGFMLCEFYMVLKKLARAPQEEDDSDAGEIDDDGGDDGLDLAGVANNIRSAQ